MNGKTECDPTPATPVTPAQAADWPGRVAVFLATGAWLGFVPFAPGTLGSAIGLPLAWGLSLLAVWQQALAIAGLAMVSIPVCTAAARRLGMAKDPGCIVLDEIVGIAATFFLVPGAGRPLVLAIGFALFRLFDISKPPPIHRLERLPEGLGIMADDWVAAVYACGALHLVLWAASAWS